MDINSEQIKALVEETLKNLAIPLQPQSKRTWLCDTAGEAIENAKSAQKELMLLPLKKRGAIIDAMRKAALENAEYLGDIAHRETGYGKAAHKALKNKLAAEKTPGIEDLTTHAFTGDHGLTLVEQAPFGVIGSITPSTNPTSTVINNAISMIAAGNSVVFNPHPAAKNASQECMRILNEAVAKADGPQTLICTVKEPTLESGKILMEHKDIPLLSVTGGEAVVRVAMKTGKKVIAAGPGNPPVIVDDTADIKKAAKDIVDGASFDNNVLCIAEKEVFAFAAAADALMQEMQANGAFRVYGEDIQKIVDTVLLKKNGNFIINRDFVGKDAAYILKQSKVAFEGDPRLVIAEVEEDHPFITVEMLMPVIGIVRIPNDIHVAIEKALKAEAGCKHSAMMHSRNVNYLSMAARALNTTIFVKNAPCYSGIGFNGEGHTTFTIATPTGEGITSARSFTRYRRCVLYGDFRII